MPSEYYFQKEKVHSESNCPIVKRSFSRNKRVPTYPPEIEFRRVAMEREIKDFGKTTHHSNYFKVDKNSEYNMDFKFDLPEVGNFKHYTKNDIKRELNSTKTHIEIEQKNKSKGNIENVVAVNTKEGFQLGFPKYFNPRLATNMKHREKVNLWIQMVPVLQIETNSMKSDCYKEHFSLYWEEFDFDGESSIKSESGSSVVIDRDHQSFIQEQKYDLLVRKIYTLEEF